MAQITPELEAERKKICKLAEESGLDFFETIFELVTYNELNSIAARGGFPTRYPHWQWGMQYEQLAKSYQYGLSKIYELVINTDPCYAYLMEGNHFLDQKLVMAHVYGHCDFFKNSQWFSRTDRKMVDTMANHAVRIRRYIDRHGLDEVEDFIDKCLSLENLIDPHSAYKSIKVNVKQEGATSSMNEFLAPSDKRASQQNDDAPIVPERDILKYLIENAELEPWQQDVLSIIRDEAYYFAPQGMTKIMNEGWASYWHSKLMTEKVMHDCDIIDFADRHSSTMAMAPGGFNPYRIGIELFREVENRWNKGMYGREWEECDDMQERANWDKKAGEGREKIFQVRRDYNDVTFVDEFLTEDFCIRNKMFVYKFNKRTGQFELDSRDFKSIKKKFLFQLTNHGQPIIKAVDNNHEKNGGLLLTHLFEGIDLQPDYMRATMENIYAIWGKKVSLATVMDGEAMVYSYDGDEFKSEPFDKVASAPNPGEEKQGEEDDSGNTAP